MKVNTQLLKDCIESLGLALTEHEHQWTMQQRRLWERAWVEIRRHQSANPADPPIPTHRLPHKGHVIRPGRGAGTERRVI